MAKALLGHVGGPDPRLVDEVRRLRRRVMDLETEIGRLLAERDLLTEVALERARWPRATTPALTSTSSTARRLAPAPPRSPERLARMLTAGACRVARRAGRGSRARAGNVRAAGFP